MHIPDGFLDISTSVISYLILFCYGYFALRKAKQSLTSEKISLISILAAGIFVAQMLNWPLPGGTSLHLVGGTLTGILLGPWMGFLTMFLVVLIQCLIFHDGGITTLGANSINMAILDVVIGYLIYKVLTKMLGSSRSVRTAGAFLGAWLGVVVAGAAAGIQIGYSSSFPYGIVVALSIMLGWHLGLGIIEGVITAFTILYLAKKAPEILQ